MSLEYPGLFDSSHIQAKARYIDQLLKTYYPGLYDQGPPKWSTWD